VMGGGSDAQIEAVDGAASELGLAFQIVDDILDVEGASKDLGKTAGKDAAAGKPTYPALYGLDRSKRMAAECLERAQATLESVPLAESRLLEIGRWIVERSN
jgi:geranylgeranyl pyrophosphate synthase